MFKPLKIDFEISEELQQVIQDYLDYMNDQTQSHLCEDCYQMEILTELNYCKREELLDPEDIRRLKEYYIWGGAHETAEEEQEHDV